MLSAQFSHGVALRAVSILYVNNFELIDNKVIQSLFNTIAYLLKSDHINSNSLLVRGIDIVANMLLNQDLLKKNHLQIK